MDILKIQQGQVINSSCEQNRISAVKTDIAYIDAKNYSASDISVIEPYGRIARPTDNSITVLINATSQTQPLSLGFLSTTPNIETLTKGEVVDGGDLFKTYYSNDKISYIRTDNNFSATAMNGEKTNIAVDALFDQFTKQDVSSLVFWINNTLIKALQSAGIPIPPFVLNSNISTNQAIIKDNKNLITKSSTNNEL